MTNDYFTDLEDQDELHAMIRAGRVGGWEGVRMEAEELTTQVRDYPKVLWYHSTSQDEILYAKTLNKQKKKNLKNALGLLTYKIRCQLQGMIITASCIF